MLLELTKLMRKENITKLCVSKNAKGIVEKLEPLTINIKGVLYQAENVKTMNSYELKCGDSVVCVPYEDYHKIIILVNLSYMQREGCCEKENEEYHEQSI